MSRTNTPHHDMGLPLHPDQDSDGHVWCIDNEVEIYKWVAALQRYENSRGSSYGFGLDELEANDRYHGRIVPPEEVSALQARVDQLESRLDRLIGTAPDKDRLRAGLIAAGVSGKTADEMLKSPAFDRTAARTHRP